MVINVALTGAVPSKQDNPAVPLTPEEIVEDVLACAEAGASVFHIHVHVRDEAGTQVHRQDLDERTSEPIRDAAPELVLCATTSSRVDPAPEVRIAGLLADPLLRPDMTSLTLGSFNFPRSVSNTPPSAIVGLLEKMAELDIRPELRRCAPARPSRAPRPPLRDPARRRPLRHVA